MIKITFEFQTIEEARLALDHFAPVPVAPAPDAALVNDQPAATAPTDAEVATRRTRKSGPKPRALPPIEEAASLATVSNEPVAPATEAPAAPVVVEPSAPAPDATAPVTEDQVKAKIEEVFVKLGFPEAQKVLMHVGAPRVREVEPARYPDLIAFADKLLAGK